MLATRASAPVAVDFPPVGVFVFESRHRRGFVMAETVHDYWKVLCPFRGAGRLVAGRARYRLEPGAVVVVPAGCRHQVIDSGDPLWLYAICVRSSVLSTVPGAAAGLGGLRVHRAPPWGGEIAAHLRALLIEQSREFPGREAIVTGLAWQILGQVWRAGAAARPADVAATGTLARERVAAYWRHLPERFHQETDLDAAAAALGLSRRSFTSHFRQVAGRSWLQALRELRLDHARRLLRETPRSVAAIAFEAGFSDLSHFYRVFRQATRGVSPEAWRRSKAARPGAAGRQVPAGRKRSITS